MKVETNKTIAILLSTYNGEKYISEQLDSIINQSFKEWNLYIRDDGSTDRTIDIVKEYSKKDLRIHIIKDQKLHRGIKDSFLFLLKSVEADYYFFCDQDDYWFKSKIFESLNLIKNYPNTMPLLVASDLELVDRNRNIISESMWDYCGMSKKINNLDFLKVKDYLTGCTMCFNHPTRDLIINNDKVNTFNLIHDQLASISALSGNGKIIILKRPTIEYRQHSNNVIGGVKIRNKTYYRFRNLRKLLNEEIKRYQASKKYFNLSLTSFLVLRLKSLG